MNIYVGNVPYAATEEDLETLFGEHGPVATATIIRDRYDGRSKGFGFVEMENQEDGERAIEALDGQDMMGRPLKVNPARPRKDRRENDEEQQNGSSEGNSSTDNEHDYFHNPYTFVPTPPRPLENIVGKFAGDFDPLDDKYGLDHASLKDHLWTGHIPIKITTVTPLVLLKGDGRKEDSTEPYDVHDRIPESSLRGMLRSAYEVVTNSRYSSFRNDDRLAYRMDTGEAAKLIPAIIKKDMQTGKLKACLYTGTTRLKPNGPRKPKTKSGQNISVTEATNNAMYAAMLTCYKPYTVKTILEGNYDEPKTGDKVYAEIVLCEKSKYLYWKAIRIWCKNDCSTKPKPGSVPDSWDKNSLYSDPNKNHIVKVVEGTVLVTNENIDKKHDERIFFFDNPTNLSQIEKVIDDPKIKDWEKLIKNYRDAHTGDDIFKRKDKDGKLKKPWHWFYKNDRTKEYAWSPHLYHKGKQKDRWGRDTHDALDLQDGDMVYARCEFTGNNISGIKDLFPVTISRELYENTPKDLLDESLHPATELDQLSPADRLFGWTPQGQGSDSGYKSRIRVVCEDGECPDILESFQDDPLPLTILGEPKPAQGRFYVAKDGQGTPQADGLSKEKAGYGEGKGLRGRKHYWHHKGLEEKNAPDYWKSPTKDRTRKQTNGRFQEYRRPDKHNKQTRKMEKQTDSQNRSIKGWIKPNKEFKASLYVQNLQQKEVGVLLWLLTLNKDLGEDDEKRYFKLGYGKPLGFGSVEIEIDTDQFQNGCLPLGTDEGWKTYYEKFDACPPAAMNKAKQAECRRTFMDSMVDAYEFLNQQTFEELPFIKGFLRVLQGPNKDIRIHYPRTDPTRDPDGKNYKWFMENERGNRYRDGKQLRLPDVNGNDQKLPYTPSEPKRKRR